MLKVQEKIELVYVHNELAAYNFGFEDARDGEDARGSLYYIMESAEWQAYNAGYIAGWQGDPACVQWLVDGCPCVPAGAFQGSFDDVMPWEERADYVGA